MLLPEWKYARWAGGHWVFSQSPFVLPSSSRGRWRTVRGTKMGPAKTTSGLHHLLCSPCPTTSAKGKQNSTQMCLICFPHWDELWWSRINPGVQISKTYRLKRKQPQKSPQLSWTLSSTTKNSLFGFLPKVLLTRIAISGLWGVVSKGRSLFGIMRLKLWHHITG